METIPEEINKALNQSYGFILLIKGKAGTGKSTLALELLCKFENPIYISTRINPPLLYKQFPWIKEYLPEDNIIDATAFEINHALPLIDEQDFLKLLKLKNLPDFARILSSKLSALNSGIVVIDSWDAIAILSEVSWGKSNSLLANFILELVRRKGLNLILIEETEKESYLDYLVDGIVCLKGYFIDNKLVRALHILKLRGIPINQPSYLFTLFNGRFHSLMTPRKISLDQVGPPPIIKDKNSKISTGILDLDNILDGGYPKGSIILIEIEPALSSWLSILTMGLTFNFLLQKRGVIGLPAPGRIIDNEVKILRNYLKNDEFLNKYLRIIEIGKEKNNLPPYVIRALPETNIEYFYQLRSITRDLYEVTQGSPILIFFSLDTVTLKFSRVEIKQDLFQVRSQIKKTDNILYLVGKIGDEMIQDLERVIDMHLVFSRINHQLTLYGKNPETNIYAVIFDTSKGIHQVKLVPIV